MKKRAAVGIVFGGVILLFALITLDLIGFKASSCPEFLYKNVCSIFRIFSLYVILVSFFTIVLIRKAKDLSFWITWSLVSAALLLFIYMISPVESDGLTLIYDETIAYVFIFGCVIFNAYYTMRSIFLK